MTCKLQQGVHCSIPNTLISGVGLIMLCEEAATIIYRINSNELYSAYNMWLIIYM